MSLLKKTIKNIIRSNNSLILICLAIISIPNLKKITKSKYSRNKKKINILVLNFDRFKNDILIINEKSEFNFYYINQDLLYYFASPYIDYIRQLLSKKKWWEIQDTKEFKNYKINFSIFLIKFIYFLSFYKKFHLIVTPSFYYFQDQCWDNAAKELHIPFFCFFKESTRDKINIEKTSKIFFDKKFKFNGDIITVYNKYAKEILIRSKVTSKENIKIIGSPRFDRLFNFTKNIERKYITLFSFRHQTGNYKIQGVKNTSGFSESGDGAVNLFLNVHEVIFSLASKFPSQIFYIKTKFADGWHKRIYQILSNFEHKNKINIKNVIITSEGDVRDLILGSKVVIGLNSTALIESRALKTDAIIPVFDELLSILQNHIYYKKYFHDQFIIANSKYDLFEKIKKYINSNYSYNKNTNKEMLETYLGTSDEHNTKRYIKLINEYIK